MNSNNCGVLEYNRIKQEAQALGISLSELCRQANVERNVLHRWKDRNPKTIDILNSLNYAIDSIKNQKSKTNE